VRQQAGDEGDVAGKAVEHSAGWVTAVAGVQQCGLRPRCDGLPPQSPGKPARLTRQAFPGANMDDRPGWGAEDVEFFVVARQRRQGLDVRHDGWLRHWAGARPDPDQPRCHG
jgi:hypothetical protein